MRNYTCFITGLAVTVGVVGSAHAISLLDYTFPHQYHATGLRERHIQR